MEDATGTFHRTLIENGRQYRHNVDEANNGYTRAEELHMASETNHEAEIREIRILKAGRKLMERVISGRAALGSVYLATLGYPIGLWVGFVRALMLV